MLYNFASGTGTAGAGARIATFVSDASSVSGTVGIENALRTAFDVWITSVFRNAGADAVAACGVRAAGRRIAGIARLHRHN